jgi:hypothetical protein
MKMNRKIIVAIIAFFICVLNTGCNKRNHIEKYNVELDSLKTLPNNFYAYRRGRIYVEDSNYRTWFNLDNRGNIFSVFNIEDFKYSEKEDSAIIATYKIDTSLCKSIAQRFVDLSKKFKFGHIFIDKKRKISFSYEEDLSEEYVKALDDSTKNAYSKKKGFKLLQNGWFENIERN